MRKRDTVIWFFKEFFGLYDDPLVDRKDVDSEVSDPLEDDDDYWADDDYWGDERVEGNFLSCGDEEMIRELGDWQILTDKELGETGGLSAPD